MECICKQYQRMIEKTKRNIYLRPISEIICCKFIKCKKQCSGVHMKGMSEDVIEDIYIYNFGNY